MEGKPRDKTRRIAVATGIACVLALVGVGMALWHPWEGVSGNGAVGEEAAAMDESAGARDGTLASGDAAVGEGNVSYTDGGMGTREERAGYLSLDPHVNRLDPATEYDDEAYLHASKACIFMGTVVDDEEVVADKNRFEMPRDLAVAVDRVYSGNVSMEGKTVSVFFPISRLVDDAGLVTQCGPRVETGGSYVFFCDLAQDSLVQDWLDDRYPTSPGLADSFDLIVSWDAYCFPVKEGLICAWKGMGWDGNPSVQKNRDFAENLFFDTPGNTAVQPPDAAYYTADDFVRALETVKAAGPLGIASMDHR